MSALKKILDEHAYDYAAELARAKDRPAPAPLQPPRLTESPFTLVEELDEPTAARLLFLRRHGEAGHEQEVCRLMQAHAAKPDPALVRRAITILEHLAELPQ